MLAAGCRSPGPVLSVRLWAPLAQSCHKNILEDSSEFSQAGETSPAVKVCTTNASFGRLPVFTSLAGLEVPINGRFSTISTSICASEKPGMGRKEDITYAWVSIFAL